MRLSLSYVGRIFVLLTVLASAALHSVPGYANVTYRKDTVMPYTASGAELITGDMVFTGNGGAGVFLKPVGQTGHMMFYRFNLDSTIAVQKELQFDPLSFYNPSICWDGDYYGVAFSLLTAGGFMILSPNGDVLAGPVALPLPASGGRTAAFKAIWTGDGYSVFGCYLQPELAGQTSYGNFYTYLMHWRLSPNGEVMGASILGMLRPTSYPKDSGAERFLYDVVWTGGAFFLAYESESQSGPPLSIYYKMLDINGSVIVPETNAFPGTNTFGPVLAWNGRTVGLTGWESIQLVGSKMYARFFDGNGVARGGATQFGQNLGVNPVISWQGDKFVTAYCASPDYGSNWTYYFTPFNENGQKTAAEYPLRNGQGQIMTSTMALAFDPKMIGNGEYGYIKSQTSDAWGISVSPMVLALNGDAVTPTPPAVVAPTTRAGFQDNGPVYFQWNPIAKSTGYTVQLARDAAFSTVIGTVNFNNTTYGAFDLSQLAGGKGIDPGTTIYWRIKGTGSSYSDPYTFKVDPNVWLDPQVVSVQVSSGSNWSASARVAQDSAGASAILDAQTRLSSALGTKAEVISVTDQNAPQYFRPHWRASGNLAPAKVAETFLQSAAGGMLGAKGAKTSMSSLVRESSASRTDHLGFTTVRYQQMAKGIPVFGGRVNVNVQGSEVVSVVNGSREVQPDLSSPAPKLSSRRAEDVARQTLGVPDAITTSSLVWYRAEGVLHLSYQVELARGETDNHTALVDAETGRVYTYFSNNQSAYSGAFVNGSGANSLGQVKTVPLYKKDNLHNPVARMSTCDNTEPLDFHLTNDAGGVSPEGVLDYNRHGYLLVLNSSEYVPNRGLAARLFNYGSTSISDPGVVDTITNMQTTLNLFQTRFHWSGWDGNGSGIVAFCHVPDPSSGAGFDNAYFSNNHYMVYGDGSDNTKLRYFGAALDVVTHEMTHGVTHSSSGLIYQIQSGALNEALSDVDAMLTDTDDWTIGEDLVKSTDPAVLHRYARNFQDPTWGGLYNPNNLGNGGQPAHMNNFLYAGPSTDNGGVHINSGIINKAAYELAQRTSRTDMGDLFFRANTVYLTPESQFIDVRRALIMAAADLFPGNAAKVTAIRQAFDSVGITEPGSTIPGPSLVSPANLFLNSGTTTLTWNAISGAKYYIAELSPDADFGQEHGLSHNYILQTNGAKTSIGVPRLSDDGIKWYWRVRSDLSQFSATREFVYGNTYRTGIAKVFNVYSQGCSGATVKSVTKANTANWLTVNLLDVPDSVPSGGNRWFQVIMNPTGLANGTYTGLLNVGTSMATRSPYPGGVTIKLQVGPPPKPSSVSPETWGMYE